MKITGVEPIMTGSDVFLKITTDAGITGYGDGTQHFLPYGDRSTLASARWWRLSVAGSWNLLT